MFIRYFLILIYLNLVISDDSIVYPCLTPNEEPGYCISLFACPDLQRLLGTATPSAAKFVKQSICTKWALRDLKVCCGKLENLPESINVTLQNNNQFETKPNETTDKPIVDKQTQREIALKKLLPTTTYCGLQHTDDRFYNDSQTALDEFPWLAHVIFSDEEVDGEDTYEFADRCNGVLISNRYVLTNGFCARDPVKVRLGQYNTNKTVSCIENPDFPECTEPTVVVRIEEQIHMLPDKLNPWYDFALFRLAKKVTYTDFIRPICLPVHDPRTSVMHNQLLFSGWGAANETGVVKKRLTYKSTNLDDCYKLEKELKEVSVNATLICLAPQEGVNDTVCAGDEGSPLMYSYKFQWFADAIITHVYVEPGDDCSNVKPIDGIRITPDVIEWILDTIRP